MERLSEIPQRIARQKALNRLKNSGVSKHYGKNIEELNFKKLNKLYFNKFKENIEVKKFRPKKKKEYSKTRVSIPTKNRNSKRKLAVKSLFKEGIIEYKGTELDFLEFNKLEELYEKVFNRKLKLSNTLRRDSNITYVYLITCKKNEVCKIGHSKHPGKRRNDLQTGYPEKLTLLFFFEGTKEDEFKLHELLSNYRLEGEWFNFNKDVLSIVNNYKEKLNVHA